MVFIIVYVLSNPGMRNEEKYFSVFALSKKFFISKRHYTMKFPFSWAEMGGGGNQKL